MSKQIWINLEDTNHYYQKPLFEADVFTAYVPASELEELKAAILDLAHKMKFGVGHYDDYDDAIELLADKARQVGGNDPGTVRFKYTEKPTQEGES